MTTAEKDTVAALWLKCSVAYLSQIQYLDEKFLICHQIRVNPLECIDSV